jgi:tRNA nucleotidyltransferase (CCA-adding enzyme)
VAVKLPPPPDPALAVMRRLQAEGWAAWFVGGCVRDRLLQRPVADWDVATDAPPETVLALFDRAIPTGLQHGTVTVVSEGLPIEVTTFRIEVGYTDGRRPDQVHFVRELVPDLARRDFTINAIAWDPDRHELVDPFDGLRDLEDRRLRAVGKAIDRFSEDGLRPLRAVRFASVLGFDIDPATWDAIPATLDTFRRVSAERIRVELVKLLQSARPGWGMERLDASGLLGVFLPEVAGLPADVRVTAWAAVDAVSGLVSRLAAPFWPLGPDAADAALRRLRFSTAEVRAAVHLLGVRDVRPTGLSDADVRRFVARAGPEAVDAVLALNAAWAPSPDWATLAARIDAIGARSGPHAPKDLPLTGREVMDHLGLPPSRRVGRILDALLERVWADPDLNTRERLLALLEAVAREVPEA